MSPLRTSVTVCLALSLALVASAARANVLSDPSTAGFAPRVPISAFARPAAWFDPSRLKFSSTVAFGTGWGGRSSALQTLGFSYAFSAPVTMNVSIGNTFGTGFNDAGRNPFFLEGFDVTWRPSRNATFRVEMRDMRSPLQYGGTGYTPGYGYARPGFDPFSTPY
ncbi:MAG: hypothetical protein RL721_1662 [Candidatus Eisenbacteria bacterium]|jgi:hypothetical protein